MTKQELIKSLEKAPDDFEISVCTTDCTGMDNEIAVEKVEINDSLKTIYLQLNEDELYNL